MKGISANAVVTGNPVGNRIYKLMKVLILANSIGGLISFRKEVVEAILKAGHEVTISAPYDARMKELEAIGAKCVDTEVGRRSTNPVKDFLLIINYVKLIKKEKSNLILSYTIKPNVYGGMACRLSSVPQIVNITGLGTAVENPSLLQKFIFLLYKIGLKKVKTVFFQNSANKEFCEKHNLIPDCGRLIPGSGVNLTRFTAEDYPVGDKIKFLFISRIMKSKGIEQYIDAAIAIRREYPNTEFHILGFCEDTYENKLKYLNDNKIVVYHGLQKDVRPFIKNVHCLIHPSFYPEGMSNVLLESCAIGRPVITTNRAGCREIVDDGVTGFIVEQQNSQDMIEKVFKFIALPWEQKRDMGLAARKKVEQEFDRNIVVRAYLEAINEIDN